MLCGDDGWGVDGIWGGGELDGMCVWEELRCGFLWRALCVGEEGVDALRWWGCGNCVGLGKYGMSNPDDVVGGVLVNKFRNCF